MIVVGGDTTFEVVADGVADDTAAVQRALDYAATARPGYVGPTVKLGFGTYRITDTLDWGPCSLAGENEHSTIINWGGPKGVPVLRSSGLVFKQLADIHFRDGKPSCWLDASADVADFGGQLSRVSFWDLDPETADAAVVLGQIVNSHHRDVRFDVGHGYCIRIRHSNGGGRSFKLDGFTVDTSRGGAEGAFAGIVKVEVGAVSDHVMVSLRDGRIEGTSGSWKNPSALVVVAERTPGAMGLRPATVRFDAIATQLGTQQAVSMVHQDTTGTVSGSAVVATGCEFGGLTTPLGGSWSGFVKKPVMPTGGTVWSWVTGRQQSNPANTNVVQVPRVATDTQLLS